MNYVLLLKIMKDIYLGQLEKKIIGLTFVTDIDIKTTINRFATMRHSTQIMRYFRSL